MCGIFLYISSNTIKGAEKKCLCSMSNKLSHRGPDQKKVRYYDNNVMMGFHRLAIVDPTPEGLQPFESSDGRFSCMTNGEIYNFRELKKFLDTKDQKIEWKTHSDCEVIVHLFDYLVRSVRLGDTPVRSVRLGDTPVRSVRLSNTPDDTNQLEYIQTGTVSARDMKKGDIFMHNGQAVKCINSKILISGKHGCRKCMIRFMLNDKIQETFFPQYHKVTIYEPSINNISDLTEALETLCKDYLDGEYSLVIYDHKLKYVFYATDELSMRPLFIGESNIKFPGYFLASEQKALEGCNKITRVPASSYGALQPGTIPYQRKYFKMSLVKSIDTTFDQAVLKLRDLLIKNTITKLSPDRDFVFLLSGGIDSSLICAIAARELAPTRIKTFTVGYSPDATDIIAARKVATHINSIHTEFICTYEEGIDMIPFAIYHNESWDQTTTRASIVMLLCLKKIREKHPGVAVVFSGEVADEMLRGYLYNRKTPSLMEGKKDQIMRLENLHTSDGIRADRCCSAYSFECRFPFFSKDLIEFSLAINPKYLNPPDNGNIEKFILRKAFDKETGDGFDYLPHEILYRAKNAFSDATSVNSGWKDCLKDHCEKEISDSRFSYRKSLYPYCTPQTKEDMLYRELFDEYGYEPTTIAFKWMSSWCDPNATDSSASTIDVFEEDDMVGTNTNLTNTN